MDRKIILVGSLEGDRPPLGAKVASIGSLTRVFRFLCSCIRLRSISRAVWVDAYNYAELQK